MPQIIHQGEISNSKNTYFSVPNNLIIHNGVKMSFSWSIFDFMQIISMYLRKFFALAQTSKKGAKSQPWALSN